MVFDTLSNSEGCLIRPSEAEPHLTLQRVVDSSGEATVFGYLVTVYQMMLSMLTMLTN